MFEQGKNIFEISVFDFASKINNGKYSIPTFQRNYVWGDKNDKLLELLNSIYKGYNIGTIIFWDSNLKNLSRTIDNYEIDDTLPEYSYVLDGQQRSLTIHALFSGEELVKSGANEIYVWYNNLDRKLEFCIGDEKLNTHFKYPLERFIRRFVLETNSVNLMSDIKPNGYDDSRAQEWHDEFELELEKFKENILNSKLLIGYKINIGKDNLEDAINQFEKINQAGIKLNDFDILNAMAYSDNQFDLKEHVHRFKPENEIQDKNNKDDFCSDYKKVIVNSYKLIKNYEMNFKLSLNANAIAHFKKGDSNKLKLIIMWTEKFFVAFKKMGFTSIKEIPYIPNLVLFIFLRYKGYPIPLSDEELIFRIAFTTGFDNSYEKSSSSKLIEHIETIFENIKKKKFFLVTSGRRSTTHNDILQISSKPVDSVVKALQILFVYKLKMRPFGIEEDARYTFSKESRYELFNSTLKHVSKNDAKNWKSIANIVIDDRYFGNPVTPKNWLVSDMINDDKFINSNLLTNATAEIQANDSHAIVSRARQIAEKVNFHFNETYKVIEVEDEK